MCHIPPFLHTFKFFDMFCILHFIYLYHYVIVNMLCIFYIHLHFWYAMHFTFCISLSYMLCHHDYEYEIVLYANRAVGQTWYSMKWSRTQLFNGNVGVYTKFEIVRNLIQYWISLCTVKWSMLNAEWDIVRCC